MRTPDSYGEGEDELSRPQKIKGYGLKNGQYLVYKFFAYRKEAVAWAKYQVSNHPGFDWKKVYSIVKVTLHEEPHVK